jgi:site-specific DNA-adenine methylase
MSSNYGIPYMGSKSDIVASIALNLPPAENFYDLFGGGVSRI